MGGRGIRVAVFASAVTIGVVLVLMGGVGLFAYWYQHMPFGLGVFAVTTVMGAALLLFGARLARGVHALGASLGLVVGLAISVPQMASMMAGTVADWRRAVAAGDARQAHSILALIIGVPVVLAAIASIAVWIGLRKFPAEMSHGS